MPDWDVTICERLDSLAPFGVEDPLWACADYCPTPVFVTAEMIRLLGYMVPVPLGRFFTSDTMLTLGDELGATSGCRGCSSTDTPPPSNLAPPRSTPPTGMPSRAGSATTIPGTC